MSNGRPTQQVVDHLRGLVDEGQLRPGDRVPSEHELAKSFETTRTSVRRALMLLKSEGVLASRQGSGTFVRERPTIRLNMAASNHLRRAASGKPNFNAEVEAQGARPEQRILAVDARRASPEIAERLGLGPSEDVVARVRLMLADDAVVQRVTSYYPAKIAQGSDLGNWPPIPGGAHQLLVDLVGEPVARFQEELEVRMPTESERRELQIPAGVPLVRVLRTAFTPSGRAVEVMETLAPADRHTFSYEIVLDAD